jgi:hypothetical protein
MRVRELAAAAVCLLVVCRICSGGEDGRTATWQLSEGSRLVPVESQRELFELLYGDDPNMAAHCLLALAKAADAAVVPHMATFLLLDDSRTADEIREGVTVEQVAAFALDSYYGFPEGRYDVATVDPERLDRRAEHWEAWYRKRIGVGFGREEVRGEGSPDAAGAGTTLRPLMSWDSSPESEGGPRTASKGLPKRAPAPRTPGRPIPQGETGAGARGGTTQPHRPSP